MSLVFPVQFPGIDKSYGHLPDPETPRLLDLLQLLIQGLGSEAFHGGTPIAG